MNALFETVKNYLVNKGASRIEVFGSRTRNDYNTESDLDVIVSFEKTPSLLSFVGFERELSELTGVKIDLLTEQSIHPLILSRIEKDRIVIYQ